MEIVNWCVEDVKKGAFEHYMLKEIFEQPASFTKLFGRRRILPWSTW